MTTKTKITFPVLACVCISLLLSGCTPQSQEVTSQLTSPSESREAYVRGSRLCIINNSQIPLSVMWRGFPNERIVNPNATECNSGYESDKSDISAEISFKDSTAPGITRVWKFRSKNSWIIQPAVSLYFESGKSKYGICNNYGENEQLGLQQFGIRGDLKRIQDSPDNIELTLVVTDAVGENFAEDTSQCEADVPIYNG